MLWGTPIFTPYIEIPHLNDYEFEELEIKQDEDSDWQYPDSKSEKLADPKVKAFFLEILRCDRLAIGCHWNSPGQCLRQDDCRAAGGR